LNALFSEIENDRSNQYELNEIKINDNHAMVPGQHENARRQTICWPYESM